EFFVTAINKSPLISIIFSHQKIPEVPAPFPILVPRSIGALSVRRGLLERYKSRTIVPYQRHLILYSHRPALGGPSLPHLSEPLPKLSHATKREDQNPSNSRLICSSYG